MNTVYLVGEDWHTAQTQPDSEFHILPSVGMQLAFFNTVKSDYKQLPQYVLIFYFEKGRAALPPICVP